MYTQNDIILYSNNNIIIEKNNNTQRQVSVNFGTQTH